VQLAPGTVLAEPGVEVDHAYFPSSGAVSLLVVMRDGKTIETGTVGARASSALCPELPRVHGR
jgi:CRP-like cAMP-binding protein